MEMKVSGQTPIHETLCYKNGTQYWTMCAVMAVGILYHMLYTWVSCINEQFSEVFILYHILKSQFIRLFQIFLNFFPTLLPILISSFSQIALLHLPTKELRFPPNNHWCPTVTDVHLGQLTKRYTNDPCHLHPTVWKLNATRRLHLQNQH